MAERLVLHIGTQKSGTTYLQRVLQALSPSIRRQGVLYPLRLAGKKEIYNHEAAAYGLLGTAAFPWVPPVRAQAQEESWAGLIRKVQRWEGTVIVSGEALSVIDAHNAARLVDSLGVDDTDIIITARDLGRVLPSSWQQHIRNGRSTRFDTFLRQMEQRRGSGDSAERRRAWEADPDHTFWRAYAIGGLVNRWAPLATSITVVGVPHRPADAHALWHRFVDAVGLAEVLPDTPPEVDTVSANVGLTEPETLVLAGLNRALDNGDLPEPQRRAIRGQIIREGFARRDQRGQRVRLPDEWVERVSTWAREDVEELRTSHARLVGEPADLLVAESARLAGPIDPLERETEIIDAAGAALGALSTLVEQIPADPDQSRRGGIRRSRQSRA